MSDSREATVQTYGGTDPASPVRRTRAWRISLVAGAVAIALSVLALAIGVRGGSDSGEAGESFAGGSSMPTGDEARGVAAERSSPASSAQSVAGVEPLENRAVVRTGGLVLADDDVLATRLEVVNAIVALGGYVADERSSADDDGGLRLSDLSLKVPSDDFDTAMQSAAAAGTVLARTQVARDVTEQVVDVSTRVRSAEASLRRIRLLLGRAESLGDVIRLEQVLSSRQADLESLLAQQQSLAAKTDLATLQVTIQVPQVAPDPDETDATGFFTGLARGWDALGAGYLTLATALGTALPTLLVLGLLVLLGRWVARRFRRSGASAAAPA